MAKQVVFLTVHGMGEVEKDYYAALRNAVKARLKSKWGSVIFKPIQYQKLLQPHEDQYLGAVQNRVSGHWLRKLMINGFADAGSLEYSRSTPDGPYVKSQEIIYSELGDAFAAAGGKALPVVAVAHSLGCEVMSNYIWDANKPDNPAEATTDRSRKHGVWFAPPPTTGAEDSDFRKFRTLRRFVTTGCNIPVFIAGLAYEERYPIFPPNDDFTWQNFYDKDDVLGYPLRELSDLYSERVEDIPVSVGNIFTGWNPMSHTAYWDNTTIQTVVADHLKSFIT